MMTSPKNNNILGNTTPHTTTTMTTAPPTVSKQGGILRTTNNSRSQRQVHHHLRMADGLPTISDHDVLDCGSSHGSSSFPIGGGGGGGGGMDLSGHAQMASMKRVNNVTVEHDHFGFEEDESWLEFCDDLPLDEETHDIPVTDQSLRLLLLQ